MSYLRQMKRRLQPKRVNVAKMMKRMQALEPDASKLRDPEHFMQVFERAFNQRQIEVFAPMAQNGAQTALGGSNG